VEEEEGYVTICSVVLDSRQGEELGESLEYGWNIVGIRATSCGSISLPNC
jgi:hypothetical protein